MNPTNQDLKQAQIEQDMAEIKLRRVANGFIMRVDRDWFVFKTLDDVIEKLRGHWMNNP